MRLYVLPDTLAVCRLSPHAPIPGWVAASALWSITRTYDELSLVCAAAAVPNDVQAELPWRVLQVAGPLDFALTGVLAALAAPLAEAEISIFALSTFDTDYVLVRADDLQRAVATLEAAGHAVTSYQA